MEEVEEVGMGGQGTRQGSGWQDWNLAIFGPIAIPTLTLSYELTYLIKTLSLLSHNIITKIQEKGFQLLIR